MGCKRTGNDIGELLRNAEVSFRSLAQLVSRRGSQPLTSPGGAPSMKEATVSSCDIVEIQLYH